MTRRIDGRQPGQETSGSLVIRTFFPHYEEEQVTVWPYTTTAVKHYSFNGMRIAISKGGVLSYVHSDHLGSSSVETNSSGASTAARTYYAYGSTRGSFGTLQTDRTFTGQKQDGTGLHYYNARYYDSNLGTFLSPDTLVPDVGRVVDYNRFLYVRANPLKYSDPSGHYSQEEIMQHFGCSDWACVEGIFAFHKGGDYAGMYSWLAILLDAQDGYEVGAWNPLQNGWATGIFQRTSEGRIAIHHGSHVVPESVFMLTGGRYPATDVYTFGQYGKYSLAWTDPSSQLNPHRQIIRSASNGVRIDPCNTWDCVALGLDVIAIGGEVFRDTSLLSTPVSGPIGIAGATYGEVITNSATAAGVARTVQQRSIGKATDVDVAVSFTLAGAGQIPLIGPIAGVAQLTWDITAPAHPWR